MNRPSRSARIEPAPEASVDSASPRYADRRIAWHVVDHLREMEDRAEPA